MFIDQPIIDTIIRGAVLAIIALGWMNLLIRLNGLRTLSKMTNFDFVTTIAFGSLLAGAAQVEEWLPFMQALAAMLGLVVAQWLTSALRKNADGAADVIGNQPRLIMRDGKIDEAALAANNMRREDLIAKLREANVLQLSEVRAAILETTGDVSVIHGEAELDDILLRDVSGA